MTAPPETGTCREAFCRRPIRWLRTERGIPMPVDPEPDPVRGNVMVGPATGLAVVLTGAVLEAARQKGLALYLPHFASCPGKARPGRR